MAKSKDAALMPVEHISQSILILRGQRVLLDADLAALYSVETRRLNEQSDVTAIASRRISYSS